MKKGEKISYGGITKIKRDSTLATLGIGYADGILKLFRKNLSLEIKGKHCKIVGSITMDSIIIDVTDVDTKYLKVGHYLEIINEDFISNVNLKNFKISIYELFTLLSIELKEYMCKKLHREIFVKNNFKNNQFDRKSIFKNF